VKVRTRLLLLGAVLPVLALLGVVALAGWALDRRLADEVDDHLLAQAAVESVGLFDGADGEPHLHGHASPLTSDLRALIPDAAIYDAAGARVMTTRHDARVPATLRWDGPLGAPTLADADRGAGPVRDLRATVQAPSGERYTLYLAVPAHSTRRTMQSYWVGALVAVLVVALLLAAVQIWAARRLGRRIGALREYLPRLRDGRAEPPPPADAGDDELSALRDGLYDAARQLEAQREREERWLATTAHDLRTPLGVIRATVDLARRRPREAPALRQALDEVHAEAVRLGAMIDALLAERRAAPDRAPVDLGQLARAAVATMAPAAAERGVDVALHAGAAPLTGDAVALRRVIDNLLHNALEHAPAGSTIDVLVDVNEGRRRLRVRDRGPGISADLRQQVFQAFWHGAGSRGAGLGLAIVRQLVGEHGGDVYVDDVDGPGAGLVVELPGDDDAAT
jgi:two-component system OmpR family sensor kinase